MSIQIEAFSNGDHAAVFWRPEGDAPIPDCRGFALVRSSAGNETYLHSFVGFDEGDALPANEPWRWPLQRYMWWDYKVKVGDTVRYRVIPVTGPKANLVERKDLASDWTELLEIKTRFTPHISAFFNKGVAASQWVSRGLDQEAPGEARKAALNEVIAKVGDPMRNALGALLKDEVLHIVDDAAGGSLYAALYELNDPELVASLEKLGAKANVILANGAFTPKRKPDENAAVRKELKTKTEVKVSDRLVSSGHFAHNKFAVVCDAHGVARKVLTGSTNWTMSGLCSQTNNGLVIDDHAVADRFLTQWNRLKGAGDGFPPELVAANSQLEQFTVDGVTVTPWFAPTSKEQDLDYARNLIANAKDGVLFLFFNPGTYQEDPGKETLLQDIEARLDSDLYIRGVVNQKIAKLTDDGKKPVTLIGPGGRTPLGTAVLVPANIKKQFGAWEDEALGASMVMVHSKVVVLDPWGDHPVLMTGSHNLGVKASKKNDDNLVILEGPAAAPLATAYAVNIIAIYQAYRWNRYATQHAGDAAAWHGLEDNDTWQKGHLKGESLEELQFWTSPAHVPA